MIPSYCNELCNDDELLASRLQRREVFCKEVKNLIILRGYSI